MRITRNLVSVLAVLALAAGVAAAATEPPLPTQGQLRALGPQGKPLGECPLKHTSVEASLSGNVCYVAVTQEFHNPFEDKIEAVYVFPLSADAAVCEMMMTVGERIVIGKVKPRDEAREIYEQAKRAGHVAGLLEQERPNIFTQSVANIEPGKKITVTIGYVETLKYEDGIYSFSFPMVVGPRYIPGPPPPPTPVPGQPVLEARREGAPATTPPPPPPADPAREVPDAGRIRPPITPEGTRAGHDISVTVHVDAGSRIVSLTSRQHEITTKWADDGRTMATVELADKKTIPNKDFVLEYSTATKDIEDAILTHTDDRGGFLMLLLQPPKRVQPEQIRGRELVFVIDSSGSMRGFPIETAKAVMSRCVNNLRANDTLNMITFAGGTKVLWDKPQANTEENRRKALEFLQNLRGRGGTEMMKAIRACLEGPKDPERVRIVCFMTDGYVGNDMAILDAVKKNVDTARVFSFGIGRSVNRYLLDGMARHGRGEVEYVYSDKDAEAAANRFYDRINAPVLTDITLDWGDLAANIQTDEVYPRHTPDLFSVKPVVLKARYTRPEGRPVTGTLTIRGRTAAGNFERKVQVTLPAGGAANKAVASMWARAKVDDLMAGDLLNAQRGQPDAAIKEQVTALGVEYSLLTQYTSFVAVEQQTVTIGGEPRRVDVPVEMPEGVSYEGVFGQQQEQMMRARRAGRAMGGGGMGFARAAKAPAPTGAPVRLLRESAARLADSAGEAGERATREDARAADRIKKAPELTDAERKARVAEIKLAEALRGLAAKLDDAGNYRKGNVIVKDGRIEVSVYLSQWDEATLKALKDAGLEVLVKSEAARMVLGRIDVTKLADLAWLDAVRRITPPDVAS